MIAGTVGTWTIDAGLATGVAVAGIASGKVGVGGTGVAVGVA